MGWASNLNSSIVGVFFPLTLLKNWMEWINQYSLVKGPQLGFDSHLQDELYINNMFA